MPDIFISYSKSDHKFADFVRKHLTLEGLTVFMAEDSLSPGDHWSPEIRSNLNNSLSIVFLASKNSCQSPYVQQELGMALNSSKRIIPVVWNMEPSQLPGWIKGLQALDLPKTKLFHVGEKLKGIASSIKTYKMRIGVFILIAIAIFGLCYLAMRK